MANINEISRKKLKRYTHKAADWLNDHSTKKWWQGGTSKTSDQSKLDRKSDKRVAGVIKAAGRLYKEETDMTMLEAFNEFLNDKEFDSLDEALYAFAHEKEISDEDIDALAEEIEATSDDETEGEKEQEPEVTEPDNRMSSLVDLAASEKPHEFSTVFNDLMKDRVADAVVDMKSQVADSVMEGKSWGTEEGARKSWKDKDRDNKRKGKKKDPEQDDVKTNEESLGEGMSRKHFQMAADTIKTIEDPKKRKEHAEMHANTFAKSNPRFDHHRFYKACGVNHLNEGKSGDSEDGKSKIAVYRTRQNKRREKEEKNAESGEA